MAGDRHVSSDVDRFDRVSGLPTTNLTEIMDSSIHGDEEATKCLFASVYHELLALARSVLRRRRHEQIGNESLVHELYGRMVRVKNWRTKSHFFCIAAKAMNHIVVDHAKRRLARKRGGGERVQALPDEVANPDQVSDTDVLSMHDALQSLELQDQRSADVARLRWVVGLTVEETATLLQIGETTVKEEWKFAKAWLHKTLRGSYSAWDRDPHGC